MAYSGAPGTRGSGEVALDSFTRIVTMGERYRTSSTGHVRPRDVPGATRPLAGVIRVTWILDWIRSATGDSRLARSTPVRERRR